MDPSPKDPPTASVLSRSALVTFGHHAAPVEADVEPVNVERRIVENDTAKQIRAALEALPASEKHAIVTAYFGQCSYHEAAVALGESESTIRSRVRDGLTRMAQVLGDSSRVVSS